MSSKRKQSYLEMKVIRSLRSDARRFMWILCALVSCYITTTLAQSQEDFRTSNSDLTRQNLSRVAASARDIKALLLKDPGLMVVLKRWVAQEATDHGQIISDQDLSDDVILGRLDTDIQFRSVATAILQRFDYLLPKLNPDSESARERQILTEERAKLLARVQAENIRPAQQKDTPDLQNTGSCESQADLNCKAAQPLPPRTEIPDHQSNPSPRRDGIPFDRVQSAQTKGAFSDIDSPLPFAEVSSSAGSEWIFNGLAPASENQPPTRASSASLRSLDNSPGATSDRNKLDGLETSVPGSAEISSVVPKGSLNRPSERNPLSPEPELVHKPNPFEDVPSLYDMYVQAVARPTTPKRFGAEIFENGTRDPQLIPMDLPAGPDYIVGPGDGLEVDLWGGVSERFYRQVDREGRVSLPDVGPVLVSGKSLADVQKNLQQVLRTMYRDVSTEVSLSRLRTIRVYEVGDVSRSGAYDISSLSTPLNALFVAGGPTQRGSMRIVNHYRGDELAQTVDLYDLLLHGVKSGIKPLENGDTVQVPSIGPQVTVEGMVRRPAIYELRNEKNLSDVLALAGGLLPTAAVRHIEVQRLVAHEKQTMLSLDIPDGGDATEITKRLESFDIQTGTGSESFRSPLTTKMRFISKATSCDRGDIPIGPICMSPM